ncbi:MAG TPA: phytanoyl-CoA dioxygenase family protein, partial [Candidatus Angelobacter sp.]
MAKPISPATADTFARDGFAFPIPVLALHEVAIYHSHCVRLNASTPAAPLTWRTHLHHHFRWAYDLAMHPAVLDAVEDLLGQDIIILSTIMFAKSPGPEFISWHQDGRHLVRDGSEPALALSAWIALTESSSLSGCLRAIPGSHRTGPAAHRHTHEKHNMLLRGETLDAEIDESRAVDMPLEPGQMSLHHVDTFHSSRPNRGREKRIGFTVRYAHPSVALSQCSAPAVLARGKDNFGNHAFAQELPSSDFAV